MGTLTLLKIALLAWLLSALGACTTMAYYMQAIQGHLSLISQAQPISDYLATDAESPLAIQLRQVQKIRAFASRELGLPDNASYSHYADIGRPYVVWNVYAAPELSTELLRWCFMVVGCVEYRGYFDKEDAQQFADGLRAQGYDVFVGGARAYSTLGWFADPVLNTFVNAPEAEIARLIFHELAHQLLYIPGDAEFNESFATVVELAGVERWLEKHGSPEMYQRFLTSRQRRKELVELILKFREQLDSLYQSNLSVEEKRAAKRDKLQELWRNYAALKQNWQGWSGFDHWLGTGTLNNAHLGSIVTYSKWVPALTMLLSQQNGKLTDFYAAAAALAKQTKNEREKNLAALLPVNRKPISKSTMRRWQAKASAVARQAKAP